MITAVSYHPSPHSYKFVLSLVMKTFKIYSFRSFQIYDIALVTIVTMFYILSPELTLLLYLFRFF